MPGCLTSTQTSSKFPLTRKSSQGIICGIYGEKLLTRNLEDEGSQTKDTSEAGAREGSDLAGTGGGEGGGLGGGGADGADRGGLDRGGGSSSGAVGVGDGGDGPGDRAGAVGDREGRSLSDRVGGTTVGNLSGSGAVGGQSRDDLGRVGDVGPGVRTSGGSEDGSSGELHFD